VLDWQTRSTEAGQKRLALVTRLLMLRQKEIAPRLRGAAFGEAEAADSGLLCASWRMGDGAALHLAANLSDTAVTRSSGESVGRPIWGGEPGPILPPWSVFWRIGG
jgi:maltooligosyltrehalose trehalohydrolase